MAITNYVKFVRGTPTAYANLLTHDSDTLYFIREKGATKGILYLGDTLISGGVDSSTAISMAGLSDVSLDGDIEDGSLLVYDLASGKWKNTPFTNIVPVMVGAKADTNGVAGLVPQPKAGENKLFLRGDGVWAQPVGVLSEEEKNSLNELHATVNSLVGDSAIRNDDGTITIPSIKEIAVETLTEALIPDGAKESLDTLQEIAQWIQNHPDDASQMSSDIINLKTRVGSLEDILYDTEDEQGNPVQGLVSVVNNLVNSSPQGGPFVTVEKYNKEIGDVSQLYVITDNGDGTQTTEETNIVAQIKSINERLAWMDLSDE